MKKCIFVFIILLLLTVVSFGQIRRPRDQEYVKQTLNTTEGEVVTATIKACDPDGDPIQIEIDDLPSGAILSGTTKSTIGDPNRCDDDPNNCVECFENIDVSWYEVTLTWTPDYTQAGEHRLHLHATDDDGGQDWVVFIINVADKNRSPVL